MAPQQLPKSFKRKYRKMHARFSIKHASTTRLEAQLGTVTATALKLIAENDMLLDILSDLGVGKNPISVSQQLSSVTSNIASNSVTTDYSDSQDTYYLSNPPDHLTSLPWDLDLHSSSGSYQEDQRKTAATASTTIPQAAQDTPSMIAAARRSVARNLGAKKRERNEQEDDMISSISKKKKKRKSALVQNIDTWTP